MSRILFRVVTLSAILLAVGAMDYRALRSRAGAPAPAAQHGLTGNYYVGGTVRSLYTDTPPERLPGYFSSKFAQVWTDLNDFGLPRTFTPPAATRVDAQIAFGQGKGFNVGTSATQPNFGGDTVVTWWPTGYALPPGWDHNEKPWEASMFDAVIWKGYIHFPKAGTYYLATVSNGTSAVYLNQARVALNGLRGGILVSDAFSYAKEDLRDYADVLRAPTFGDPRTQYVTPVPIDAARDLSIEVRYSTGDAVSGHGSAGAGIDFFWVTPDSPRDANGKPIASIVPSDALYTEASGPIDKPIVRGANFTISADFLYFPARAAEGAVTLTVRLADKDGNPVR
ncbi:MAG TPA: hypothetical protein VNB49_09970, partial [Candidatus Dormibacteraeota bacterium]|nr:hypothetical protein [Candidatus Dormibacteraeota bacterium]